MNPEFEFELLPSLDGCAGPARRLSNARSMAMIEAALDAAWALDAPTGVGAAERDDFSEVSTTPKKHAAGHRASDHERSFGRRSPPRLLMAAVLVALAVGAASAGAYLAARATDGEPAPSVLSAKQTDAPASHEPVVAPPVVAPAVVAPVPVEATMPELAMDPDVVGHDDAPADASPEDLLRLANQRRRDKRWRAADALYRRVMRDHARSDSAYVATVASAALHLDHLGDPDGARTLYRRALRGRGDGQLAEEARWGLVEAARATGKLGRETKALRDFLAHHPDSPLASRAQARLDVLAASDP